MSDKLIRKNQSVIVRGKEGKWRVKNYEPRNRAGKRIGILYELEEIEDGRIVYEFDEMVHKGIEHHDDISDKEYIVGIKAIKRNSIDEIHVSKINMVIERIIAELISEDFESGVENAIQVTVIKIDKEKII